MHMLGLQPFTTGELEQGADDFATDLGCTRIARHAKSVSAAGNLYVEAAFNLPQVLVELATKIGETVVVGGFQDDVPGNFYGVQWLAVKPLE
jgi:hypothetical protein